MQRRRSVSVASTGTPSKTRRMASARNQRVQEDPVVEVPGNRDVIGELFENSGRVSNTIQDTPSNEARNILSATNNNENILPLGSQACRRAAAAEGIRSELSPSFQAVVQPPVQVRVPTSIPNNEESREHSTENVMEPEVPANQGMQEGISDGVPPRNQENISQETIPGASPVKKTSEVASSSTGNENANKINGIIRDNKICSQGTLGTLWDKASSYLLPFLRSYKFKPENPLDILLSAEKQNILAKLNDSLTNMDGTYKSLYFWDRKDLGATRSISDILHFEISKTTKVFGVDTSQTQLIYKDQFDRTRQKINMAIQQSHTSPCILFMDRIDYIIHTLDGLASSTLEHRLSDLFFCPILFVATSRVDLPNAPEIIQRMFRHGEVVPLQRPAKKEVTKLFFQMLMKYSAFETKFNEISQPKGPPHIYGCEGCLKYINAVFGVGFQNFMDNIWSICENRTAHFIFNVYETLIKTAEKKGLQRANLNAIFKTFEEILAAWKLEDMESEINHYDR